MTRSSSTVVSLTPPSQADAHAPAVGAMWTSEDVAAYLQVSVSWVRHRVAAAKLPHHRVGGWMVRFEPAEIRAWATARERS